MHTEMKTRIACIMVTTILGILLGGCTPSVTVSPLDRGFLADYTMRPDRDKLSHKLFDHAYYSRETSRGGRVLGGGGCGCN